MEHIWYKCTCNEINCMFCEGGLGSCTVCGGFEGTLTKECCGHRLDSFILDAIYKGGLNYISNEWIVQELKENDFSSTDGVKWVRLIKLARYSGFIPNFIANILIKALDNK